MIFGDKSNKTKGYFSKRKLWIAEHKDRIQHTWQILSALISVVTIICIIYYHGFYISIPVKNLIRWVVYGSLFFFVLKYFLFLYLSLHRLQFLRRSWFEFLVICMVIVQFIAVVIFKIKILSNEHLENYYLVFTQIYFFVIMMIEMAKMSASLGKHNLSPPVLMICSFLFLICIGTILLMMPRMTVNGISFIDALFTATSASCITGLSVVSTSACFTFKGQLVIMILIQLGGMSLLSFATFFTTFLSRSSVGLRYQYMVRDMVSADQLADSYSLLRSIVITTFIIEFSGAALLYTYWHTTGFFVSNSENIFYSLFYTISAFNNGGFVLMDESLLSLGSMHSYFPQVIIMVLVFLGGIGFLTIRDFFSVRYIRERKKYPWKSLMPQTKVILITTFALITVCSILFFFIEKERSLAEQNSFLDKVFTSVFQIVTCRTSGFTILDLNSMSLSTIIIIIMLMFIGGSPGSTAGGIKTTTFFVMMQSVISTIKGKKRIEFQHHTISFELVDKANSIIMMTVTGIIFSIFLITLVEPTATLRDAIFETTSAITTCGLSTGIISEWNTLAKFVLVVDMFCGRIGTLTLAFALTRHKKEPKHRYPDLYMMVG